jgi:DNA-binding HxlR family transcriptional regulator
MQASKRADTPDRAPRRDHAARPCPIGRAGTLLGDAWTLLIARDATAGTTRFEQFRDNLGIADNVLADRLRRLTEAGILLKVPYRDGGRTRHEYRLGQAGADLLPVLRALAEWGATYTSPAEPAAAMLMIHDDCGGRIDVGGRCERCGADVPRDQERWIRPWRTPASVTPAEPVS